MQIRGTWSAGPGDDQARFLADMRALRDSAAIGYDELAARAHYPSHVLKEAENGPALPGLPILTAYVRACEGDVPDWEERWRRLNPEVADDPNLPVRPAGASPAAVAGARAGVGVAPPDVYDPDRIRAALRGDKVRSGQVGRRADDPGVLAQPASAQGVQGAATAGIQDHGSAPSLDSAPTWESAPSWDKAADPTVPSANGNHSTGHGNRGPFDAAFTTIPEPGEPAQDEEFSWLNKDKPEAQAADSEQAWSERTEAAFGWLDRSGTELTSQPEADSEPPDADFMLRLSPYQASGLAPSERTDFWGQPVPPASADLQAPAASPRTEEPLVTPGSWTAPSDAVATPAAEPAHRAPADASLGTATTAQPHSAAGSTAQATVTGRNEQRHERFFTARLLVVIVIAALIGSTLVLLLR